MNRKQRHGHHARMFAWLLCCFAIAGGGAMAVAAGNDPPMVKLADEYQAIMQDIVHVLEEVQSEESARKAIPALTRLQKKLAGHSRRARGTRFSDEAYQALSEGQKKRVDKAVRVGFQMRKEAARVMKDRAMFRQIGDLLLAIRGDGKRKIPAFSNRALAGTSNGQVQSFTSGRFSVDADDGSYEFWLLAEQVANTCDTNLLSKVEKIHFKLDGVEAGLSAVDAVSFTHTGRSCVGGVGKLFIDSVEPSRVTGKLYAYCGDGVVNGTFVATRHDCTSAATGRTTPATQPNLGEATSAERDHYGDPLPAGAIRRLGTVRLRHPGMSQATLSPGRFACPPRRTLMRSGPWR